MWVTCHGQLAGTTLRYVDDLKTVGSSKNQCWAAGHRVATYFSFLGLQVALRKYRAPMQHPSLWASTIAFSCEVRVGVTCPHDKWVKAKGLQRLLKQELLQGVGLAWKPLESMKGFFIHLMRTFLVITPYPKGMHLTLDGWRGNRRMTSYCMRPP
jgi:hypothetical protein